MRWWELAYRIINWVGAWFGINFHKMIYFPYIEISFLRIQRLLSWTPTGMWVLISKFISHLWKYHFQGYNDSQVELQLDVCTSFWIYVPTDQWLEINTLNRKLTGTFIWILARSRKKCWNMYFTLQECLGLLVGTLGFGCWIDAGVPHPSTFI